jgi:Fe(3+) dicitrate transport protein
MKSISLVFSFSVLIASFSKAQISISKSEIVQDTTLVPLEFIVYSKPISQGFMPDLKDGVIYSGKVTHNVDLKNLHIDATISAGRQWFSKVPGVSVWESDGSGLNTSISVRGWSPNRSWDMNVRMDGMDIASDPMGYPEAYYTPLTEFIENIEMIKGAGALSFGTQFGGAINYQTVEPSRRKIKYQGLYCAGQFGTESHFHGISGTHGKSSFGAWFQERISDGWRENSQYRTRNYLLKWNRNLNKNWSLKTEYTKHHSISQQPGGLTDAQFDQSIFLSNRSRNWFEIDWQVLGISSQFQRENFFWKNQISFLRGERNSVGNLNKIFIDDVYVDSIGYSQRKLDKDLYLNAGFESRYEYKLLSKIELAGGIRIFQGNTLRRQNGRGTRGVDANFNLDESEIFDRNLDYRSRNFAVNQEAIIHLAKQFKVISGLRYEWLENSMEGRYSSNFEVKGQSKNRNVLLFGMSTEYKINSSNEIVFNYNRSFRPALFSELTPTSTTDIIDPNIRDASGYNWDGLIRGKISPYLNYHLGVYYTFYGNRIGTYLLDNKIYKTNIGDAISKGVEVMCDYSWINADKRGSINFWASLSWMSVKYVRWNDPNILTEANSIKNKRVEYAPNFIHRIGVNFAYKKFSCQITANFIGSVYTDAINTERANEEATIGRLSGYSLYDGSIKYRFSKHVNAQINLNNILNSRYATRRSIGYPGPGLLPGSPRTTSLTLAVDI